MSLPEVSFESWYYGIHSGDGYSLASGSKYSMHGDFFAAWDPRLQNGLVAHCMNKHQRSCSAVQVWPSSDVAPYHKGDVTSNGEYLFNINNPKYAAATTRVPEPSVAPTPAGHHAH